MANSMNSGMINSLTGLRFYAALLVFFSHFYIFSYFLNLQSGIWYEILQQIGWLGVSLFFVLSGFVLYVNYLTPEKQKKNCWDFYTARFARIYPVFILTTLVAIPIELFSPEKRPVLFPLAMNTF